MATTHLGEFELLVLAALMQLGEEAYGVSVRRDIEARTGRPASIGAVYTTLSRLVEKGFVSTCIGQPTAERGGRAKRHFAVQPAGRTALVESLTAVDRMIDGLALT